MGPETNMDAAVLQGADGEEVVSHNWLRRALVVIVKTVFALALLAWLVRSGRLEPDRLLQLRPSWMLGGLILLMPLSMYLTAVRWWYLLRIQRVSTSLAAAARLTWVGYFAGMVLPGFSGGDLAKAYLAVRGRSEGRLRAVSTVVADRFLGLYTFLILGIGSVAWLRSISGPSAALAGMLGTMLLIFAGMSVGLVLIWSPLRPLVTRWLPQRLAAAIDDSWELYRDQPLALAGCGALSLVCNATMLACFAAASASLGLSISLASAFQVGPLVVLANCLPLTPGGTGVGEATSDRLFAALGLAGGAEVMLLVRLVMLLSSLPALLMLETGGMTNDERPNDEGMTKPE